MEATGNLLPPIAPLAKTIPPDLVGEFDAKGAA
jgi:hypothetical protein